MPDTELLTEAELFRLMSMQADCLLSPWSDEQLIKFLNGTDKRFVVGLYAPELCGFAIFSSVLDEAELLQIGIEPDRQGIGMGQHLLEASLVVLRQKGISRLFLEVRVSNRLAIGLYRKMGFTEDGIRKAYYPALLEGEQREDALLMSLVC